ncbi:muramoyltetrapeptide carboxypeptidase [Massilia cavernae]|uniref:Muramoyltetrapeptide carboxypeptidase n=1 Tax=Massilia cavernae TaxID=2320864 RepID=A0A418Y877_9BURK|nr:muramoyltetrapeptide carboxypeptidase [Massilia cavernae]RJG27641.1 muramoyltetrapeptide carboxypeptidase [Massilia cavernae]
MSKYKPGIGIVAPSGYTLDDAAIERGIRRLEARGHAVHNYFDTGKVFQRFGGTDEARLAQLQAAACNPDIDVVIALRGQYGLSRLLPRIDFDLMAQSGKIFVGFSDFTAFQMALMAKTGAMSYAGPMFFGDFGAKEPDEFTLGDFWRCLEGPAHRIAVKEQGNPCVEASGTLWGGNLAMVLSVLGTEYFPQVDGGILFFEDVNEHPYRVERMLLQLMHAGVIERQKAVVLGDFSSYGITPADNGYNFGVMVDYLRSVLPVPVLTGLPFGHGRTRATIPFGAHARLVSDADGFTLTMSGYPTIAHV